MASRSFRWTVVMVLLVFVGLVGSLVALVILRPGPDGRLVMATGGSDGAYQQLALNFSRELARHGVTLLLRNDLQGSDTLKALRDDASGVHAGIIKGGYVGSLTGRLASAKAQERHDVETAELRSAGRLFLEPIWVFTRGSLPIESLRDLKGKRILAGVRQSGARRVAMQLLRANGVTRDNSNLAEEELTADGQALISGNADAAILILPPDADRIHKLLRVPGIRLMNFEPEVAAYTGRFPALTKVVLHRGSVEFEPVVPSEDITLLSTSAALVIRRDLHPALASLLAHTVINNPKPPFDAAGDPVLFHKAGQFPTADDPEYVVFKEVRQVYRSGDVPLLLRLVAPLHQRLGLPFSFTTFANAYGVQTLLLLIPALTIFLPLMRIIPYLYRWAIRQRLLYWYRELKTVERNLDKVKTRQDAADQAAEIERIDLAARRIRVPLEFSDQLYDLRGHIDLVQRRLAERLGPTRMAAE